MENILTLKNLNKFYDEETHAVKDADLEVKKGDFLILLGLSGSGKSTLLRCINRLIEPTSGKIFFEENNICDLKGKELRHVRREIGMIFQQFNLIKNLTVLTNVLSGRLGYYSNLKSLLPKLDKSQVEKAMENLKRVGLEKFAKQKVRNLSGGQQQRVAISRVLMQSPKLILADEPVASLDPATADSVMSYLGNLNKNDNITIICSLHFLSLARKYGSRVVALKDGRLMFDGEPEEIDEQKFKDIYGQDAEEVDIK